MERVISNNIRLKRAISFEGLFTLFAILVFFGFMSYKMDGAVNMFKTFMNTAYDLLINTVFYIMAIAVLAGAFGSLITELGVVSIINRLLSKVMKPLYGMPGAAALGLITTYLSDNPAILTLSKDKGFRNYFKKYQMPALTNLGTAFGMGLVVTTYMISLSSEEYGNFVIPTLIGNVGAIIGSIVSVRIMLLFTKRLYGTTDDAKDIETVEYDYLKYREIRKGPILERALDSILEGGKSGVEMGLAIIPGVLIICTLVLMLTNGAPNGYTGAAYEGIGLLPDLAEKIDFIIQPLFGFSSPEAIAFPITAIGAVGAALSFIQLSFDQGVLFTPNDIAVFTAIGMCWSGYLSTHVAMMDSLNSRELTGKAILSHTIGGLIAGISAHFLYILIF